MHAAKGLEFPVVFVVTDKTATSSRSPLLWTDDNGIRNILPALSNSKVARQQFPDLDTANSRSLYQLRQERRRLLYVALTRAQAMLFVPMHLRELPNEPEGIKNWSDYIPRKHSDIDLTPRLAQLLENRNDDVPFTLFDLSRFTSMSNKTPSIAETRITDRLSIHDEPSFTSLNLFSRICRQTS